MSATYVDPGSRARINDCKSRLDQLRRERTRLGDHIDSAKLALKNVSGSTSEVTQSPEFRTVEGLMKDQRDLQLKIGSVEQEQTYLLGRISGTDAIGTRDSFLNDPSTLEELRLLAESSQPIGDRLLGTAISRDQLLADYQQRRETAGFGSPLMAAAGDVTLPSDVPRTQFYGVVPQVRRALSILDIMPSAAMEVGVFDFMVESGPFTGAAETVDLALKPTGNVTFTEMQAKAQTIAAWLRLSRPQAADVPGMADTVNTRLRYIVERRLENQILSGDGTGANLLGILNTSGIGSPASVSGDSVNSDLVMDGITTVELSEVDPDAVVVNPQDYNRMLKVKASGSGERLDSDGALSVDTGSTIWNLPAIRSVAIPSGTALVGSFALGGVVYIREGMNVRISDADGSDFVNNAFKVLCEMRAALAIYRPSAFAKVTLTFPN